MEDDINGRQPQWKMTTLACLTSQFCSEFGPAQPQLVPFYFLIIFRHSFVFLEWAATSEVLSKWTQIFVGSINIST